MEKWHKYPDELPDTDDDVVVALMEGQTSHIYYETDSYNKEFAKTAFPRFDPDNGWLIQRRREYRVVAWMYIPDIENTHNWEND